MRHENIRKLLKIKKLKQVDLAALLGRDKSVITHLFQGKRKLSADEAAKVAQFFNVSSDVVLDRAPIPEDGDNATRGMEEAKMIPFHSAPQHVGEKSTLIQEKGDTTYLAVENSEEGDFAFEVPDNSMNLAGLLMGDIAIASMEGAPVKARDVVIVQHYESDGAKTLLRRYQSPHLRAESTDSDAYNLHLDEDDVRIVAPIKRMMRLY